MSYSQVDNNKNLVWFLNYCFNVPKNIEYKTVIKQKSIIKIFLKYVKYNIECIQYDKWITILCRKICLIKSKVLLIICRLNRNNIKKCVAKFVTNGQNSFYITKASIVHKRLKVFRFVVYSLNILWYRALCFMHR